MNFPLQPVLDVKFGEQVHHVGIGAEEDVKSGFNPIAVFVLPCTYFSAEYISVDTGMNNEAIEAIEAFD